MKKIDIVVSFDDTGSMSAIRKQVRQKIQSFVREMFQVVEDIRVGIIIHNDYCDHDLYQHLDLTSDEVRIANFIRRDSSQGGGDHREAYAYVLNRMKQFSWRSDAVKVAVLIGDAPPHEKGSKTDAYLGGRHTEKFDWRTEVTNLRDDYEVKVYPIQALNRGRMERKFYEGIASFSGTVRLDLQQFHHVTQYLLAIAHKEAGTLEEYVSDKPEYGVNISLRNMFATLTGATPDVEFAAKAERLGQYQICSVDSERRIKDFVNDMGISYKAGRGFYEWNKSETIQENKEVIFVDKESGETIFDTSFCRSQLGVPLGSRGRINPRNFPSVTRKYQVFIQSTSYTRLLKPRTTFLYEIHAH